MAIYGPTGTIIFEIFLALIILGSVAGNALVILTWCFQPSVRASHNLYLLSLAVADLLVGLILAPTMLGSLIPEKWPFGPVWCYIYLYLAGTLTSVSFVHIVAISMDRYHIIFDTITYMNRRTHLFFLQRILMIWIVSLWLSVPILLDCPKIGNALEKGGICTTTFEAGIHVYTAFGNYVIPVAIFLRTYAAIFRKLKLMSQKDLEKYGKTVSAASKSTESNGSSSQPASTTITVQKRFDIIPTRKHRRAAKMLAVIIAASTLSWFPFTLLYAIIGFTNKSQVWQRVMTMSLAIGYSNSVMNPIIYALCNSEFKKGFKKVVTFWKR